MLPYVSHAQASSAHTELSLGPWRWGDDHQSATAQKHVPDDELQDDADSSSASSGSTSSLADDGEEHVSHTPLVGAFSFPLLPPQPAVVRAW